METWEKMWLGKHWQQMTSPQLDPDKWLPFFDFFDQPQQPPSPTRHPKNHRSIFSLPIRTDPQSTEKNPSARPPQSSRSCFGRKDASPRVSQAKHERTIWPNAAEEVFAAKSAGSRPQFHQSKSHGRHLKELKLEKKKETLPCSQVCFNRMFQLLERITLALRNGFFGPFFSKRWKEASRGAILLLINKVRIASFWSVSICISAPYPPKLPASTSSLHFPRFLLCEKPFPAQDFLFVCVSLERKAMNARMASSKPSLDKCPRALIASSKAQRRLAVINLISFFHPKTLRLLKQTYSEKKTSSR